MTSILLVDDNVHLIAMLGKMLAPIGRVQFATSGEDALEQIRRHPPDLVLLDTEMPGMSGYAVCEVLRADAELREIPVIFVTAHDDAEAEVRGLAAGAVDFIAKPVNEAVLLARVSTHLRLKAMTDDLRRSAAVDGLTGVANRAAFDQRLRLEGARVARTRETLALLMLDVDHFKKYNDRYGHPAGDECLKRVATALAGQARRTTDLVARIGGEEFALLLPGTDERGAIEAAERIVVAIRALCIPHGTSPTADRVTVSIGVATCEPVRSDAMQGMDSLVDRADQALYRAKAHGRDRLASLSGGPCEAPSGSATCLTSLG